MKIHGKNETHYGIAEFDAPSTLVTMNKTLTPQRSSTRLHHAPGGSSTMGSLIFGGGDNSSFDDNQRNRRGVRKVESPEQHPLDRKDSSNNTVRQQFVQQQPIFGQQPGGSGRVSSNQFASGSSQNTGNVITDRSTTRIHAPPGGASSFRLG